MMKKIFALVFILVLGKMSYSQNYPLTQQLGSDSTIVISKGALQSRLAPIVISDTTAANNQRIKNYPGAQLYTANGDFYVRNATATKWVLVSSGSSGPINIYNSDGTLTGNRVLTGAGNSLTFNGISGLGINKVADSVFTVEGGIHATGGLRLDNLVSSPGTKTLRIDGQGVVSVADTTVSGGTVTSVGLTMPTAFNVSGSPITSAGTLSVTAAGVASQYIRGDGQLATLPTTGGGGSSVSYYLNGSVNQGTFGGNTYYQMNKTPVIGTGTDFTISSNGYIASFITDAGDPDLLNIPAGNWDFEIYFQSSSNSGTPSFYVELYKYNGTTFTLIASSSTNPKFITSGTNVDAYYTPLPVPATTLAITDRLAIRVYVNNSGNTITLHTEDNNLCQVITTFSTGINALNGLTDQVQYFAVGTSGTDFNISSLTDTHTFNLPTASATNRGALSSADWTTFNGKVGGSGTSGQVSYFNGTNSITSSPTFAFTPTSQLLVNNSVTAASAIARGINATPSLTAAANNNVLVGLDINPTFTNGAFTGVRNVALRVSSSIDMQGATIGNIASGQTLLFAGAGTGEIRMNNGNGGGFFYTYFTNGAERMRLAATTGNLLLNTTTDAGFRLDVNGTARVNGNLTANSFEPTSGTLPANGIYLSAANTVAISTNSGNRLTITSGSLNTNTVISSTAINTSQTLNGTHNTFTHIAGNTGTTLQLSSTGVATSLGISNSTTASTANSNFALINGSVTYNHVGSSGLGSGIILNVTSGTTTTGANNTLWGGQINATSNFAGTTAIGLQLAAVSTSGTARALQTTTGDVVFGSTSGNVMIGTTTAGGRFTIQPTNDQVGMAISGSSLTGSNAQSLVSLSQTWNTTGNPTAFLLNITNTASGATADLMDLQVGGASRFEITAAGRARLGAYGSGTITGTATYNLAVDASGNVIEVTGGGGGGGIGGSGTTNYVPKFTASTTLGNSQLFDNGTVTFLGNGDVNGTPSTGIFSGTGGTGSNVAGAELRIRGGASTGNAAGGIISFYTSDAGISGTGVNAATEKMRLDGTGSLQVIGNITANNFIPTGAGVPVNGLYLAAANSIGFATNTTPRMRIDASGNVGIGTATIGSTLQVNGNAAIGYSASTAAPTNGLAVSGNLNVGTTTSVSKVNVSDKLRLWDTTPTGAAVSNVMGYMFNTSSVPAGSFVEDVGTGIILSYGVNTPQAGARTTSVVGGIFRLDTRSTQQEFTVIGLATGGSTEAQRIGINLQNGNTILAPVAGNVGVGISAYGTMGSKLQVNGNAAIGYSASTAAPTNGLAVAGNVGIGIAAPATNLHVYRTTAGLSGMQISNLTHGSTVTDGMFVGVDDTQGYIYMYENLPIQLSTNSTVRLFINNDGTVFVGGTNAPASPTTGILSGSGATGTNVAGAELRIRGGASTGSGAGGPITFYTSAAGTAGTTVNAATERMRIYSDGMVRTFMSTTNTTQYFASARITIQQTSATNNNFANLSFLGANSDDAAAIYSQISAHTAGATSGNLVFATSNAASASTARMTITSTGLVGINTQTIGSQLQVNGGAAIGYSASTAAPTNGLQVAGSITGASNSNTFGTSSASGYPVIVNTGSGASALKINGRNNAPGDESGIEFFRFDGVTRVAFIQASTNFFAFATSSEAMRINSSNFLGIGTTTIGSRLQVNGGAAIGYSASTAAPTNGLIVAGNAYFGGQIASLTDVMQLKGSGNVLIAMQSTVNTQFSGMNLYNEAGTLAASFALGNSNTGSFSNHFFLGPRTASGNLLFVTGASGTTRMTMTTNGELQFTPAANTSVLSTTGAYSLTGSNAQSLIDLAGTWNTTGNPTAIKLNITNTASGANSLLMDLQVGGNPEFRVTRTGNVVVNGSTSTYQMHVVGTGSLLALGEESFTTGRQMLFGIDGSGNGEIQSVQQGTSYRNLSINPLGGNVGIATSSPTSTLSVNGSVAKAITTKTATYTLTSSDHTVIFNLNGNATANLPDATTCTGRIYMIKINRTNTTDTLTIDPNGTQTIDGFTTYALQCQYAVTIQSDGSNWQIVGDFGAGLNCL